MFPFALGGVFPLHGDGTFRAVFGAVGAGEKEFAAHATFLPVQPVEQGGLQLLIQRQHRNSEPLAEQGVGNALNADTFLPVVQCDTIPGIVVAALMY